MSMFHELMMRKKEEIMYATIKGTLTENDGVFSGFSASNYLETANYFTPNTNTWSFVVNLDISNVSSQCYYFSIGERSFISSIQKNNNNSYKVYIYKRKIDDSGWEFSKSVDINFSQLNIFIKIGWNGNKYTLDYSYDNSNWLNATSVDSSIPILQTGTDKVYLGIWLRSSSYFYTGTIDLPNSYIKLGSTKYNLQAVVGYTIVGSPTIVDGVVSGFSASDYLQLPQISAGTVKSFEISTKLTTGGSIADAGIIAIALAYNYGINTFGGGNFFKGRFYSGVYYEVNSPNNSVVINTTYYVKFIVDTTLGKEYLKISTDNSTWQTYEKDIPTSVIDKDIQWRVGRGQPGVFNGSVDLNNTDIKVNNKLFFNGQPS